MHTEREHNLVYVFDADVLNRFCDLLALLCFRSKDCGDIRGGKKQSLLESTTADDYVSLKQARS